MTVLDAPVIGRTVLWFSHWRIRCYVAAHPIHQVIQENFTDLYMYFKFAGSPSASWRMLSSATSSWLSSGLWRPTSRTLQLAVLLVSSWSHDDMLISGCRLVHGDPHYCLVPIVGSWMGYDILYRVCCNIALFVLQQALDCSGYVMQQAFVCSGYAMQDAFVYSGYVMQEALAYPG